MTREILTGWGIGIAVLGATCLLGRVVGGPILRALARVLRRSPTDLDDMVLRAAEPLLPYGYCLLGAVLGANFASLDPRVVQWLHKLVLAGGLILLSIGAATFVNSLITSRAARWPGGLPATTLTQSLVRLVIIGLGLLVVLGNLGIAIAPLLTALGVGSLAVALALQPTLSNLFAGFQITLARRIRVGDYVELETGQKGFVTDIGWRSTQLCELSNNLVIVPNARLAEVIVRNYSLPEGEQAVLVEVGVAYGADLATVEAVTFAAARESQQQVPGAIHEFEPFLRFHTFADSAIEFTVILRVESFVDRFLMKHDFMKRLHRHFAAAGIEIPFPQRVLHSPMELGRAHSAPSRAG